MHNRRDFLRLSSFGIPLLAEGLSFKRNKRGKKPLVVATWDSGLPVSEAAWEILKNGSGRALDAVERGAIYIENQISCCVGLGGNPDRDGIVTLDACIMDDQFNCGSVAGLERIKNPISVARKVMEETPHVMLVGAGAQQFAIEQGFPLESSELSVEASEEYKKWLIKSEYKPGINIEQSQLSPKIKENIPPPKFLENGRRNHDTMGLVALGANGQLAGACTTSGMAFKMRGRVGDSPIIGSGLYVDGQVGAVVATGQGEEVIRTSGSHLIVELIKQGKSPSKACKIAIERIVKINSAKARDFQVAYLAIDKKGVFGAYAIQKGFSYAVRHDGGTHLIAADSYF